MPELNADTIESGRSEEKHFEVVRLRDNYVSVRSMSSEQPVVVGVNNRNHTVNPACTKLGEHAEDSGTAIGRSYLLVPIKVPLEEKTVFVSLDENNRLPSRPSGLPEAGEGVCNIVLGSIWSERIRRRQPALPGS